MANSPLFGRWQNIQTIRGAVVALGMGRVREIATSCCMLNLLPEKTATFDPRIFWEHSLGVAFVARRMARKIGYCDPEHAYLAGLIHDIGLILNFLVLGDQFVAVLREAANTGVPIGEVEAHSLGLDHALTGGLLAEHWALADDLKETIRRHHLPERAQGHHELICMVNLSDTLCRSRGLGYGFSERSQVFRTDEPAWLRLVEKFPGLTKTDFAKLSSELDPYLGEVRNLVSVLFRMQ
jgi:putative nucleotidyltransferase with HDIG domain